MGGNLRPTVLINKKLFISQRFFEPEKSSEIKKSLNVPPPEGFREAT